LLYHRIGAKKAKTILRLEKHGDYSSRTVELVGADRVKTGRKVSEWVDAYWGRRKRDRQTVAPLEVLRRGWTQRLSHIERKEAMRLGEPL